MGASPRQSRHTPCLRRQGSGSRSGHSPTPQERQFAKSYGDSAFLLPIVEFHALRGQQLAFADKFRSLAVPVESAQSAIRGDDTMTRNLRREGVATKRLAYGLGGAASDPPRGGSMNKTSGFMRFSERKRPASP